jgi:hypothetical protein
MTTNKENHSNTHSSFFDFNHPLLENTPAHAFSSTPLTTSITNQSAPVEQTVSFEEISTSFSSGMLIWSLQSAPAGANASSSTGASIDLENSEEDTITFSILKLEIEY